MSKDYAVVIVDEPSSEQLDIENCKAQVFMRFTEKPSDDFLRRVARIYRGRRIYCLYGASTWISEP